MPGPRGAVVATAAVLVLGLALAVADTVAGHVTSTAVDEAVLSVDTIVRGDVDELLTASAVAHPTSGVAAVVNARLERLTATNLLRIKIWSPDGTVIFSDLPALRGRTFAISDELAEALAGEVATELTAPAAIENTFEEGLADRVLEVYLPLRDPVTGSLIGAYEVYQNAAHIEAQVDATRRDALIIVGVTGAGLLLLLYLGFSGTARRLAWQNRQLRERTQAQELLAADLGRSEERFRSLVHNSADIIAVVDAGGTITYASPAVERMLGYSAEERVGHSMLDILDPDGQERIRRILAQLLRSPREQATTELRLQHRDGGWRVIEVVAMNRLDDPAVRGIVLNSHDVTERKELEDQLTRQAFHDSLTGLANRALFVDRVAHALTRSRDGQPIAVLFLDLDDFKAVNDVRGHSSGDRLLVAVGERVRSAVRDMDSVARLGGDEFAVLIEDAADRHTPVDVAQRILDALRAPVRVAGEVDGQPEEAATVRASVGIAISMAGQSADQLLSNADIAMYLAKGEGGNRFAMFDARMSAEAVERLSMRTDLDEALARGELHLVYQPIVDLQTGRVTKVEALLRWDHPSRGPIPPAVFIPLAEQSGAIVGIGRWVLETACGHLVALGAEGHELSMSVNVSGRQLGDDDFVACVATVLAASGLAPERLVLEMTESVLIRDVHSGLQMMTRLRAMGVRLAIDDFGTGYSSLSYLSRFPVDFLKIDRSFVAELGAGEAESNLVRTIVEMGRSLGLETIAEGIEEASQLDLLRSLGTNMGQGYLLARPMSFERLTWHLRGKQDRVPTSAQAPRPA
jgi:diguanylate cyclase (GGDEF)-like protein/PAS domain S-box-containing protein